jgi:hypothetical protein
MEPHLILPEKESQMKRQPEKHYSPASTSFMREMNFRINEEIHFVK